jgi:preprotein translocase subunit SecA
VQRVFNLSLPVVEWGREEGIDETQIRERIARAVDALMAAKAANTGPELMRYIEKSLLLQILDQVWKEHLLNLDHLRQGIYLRSYGQRDPLNEYKREAFALFNAMLDELRERVTTVLARIELRQEAPPPPPRPVFASSFIESHPAPEGAEPEMAMAGNGDGVALLTAPRSSAVNPADPSTWHHSARNAPCPCGSGKKYKHCHGRMA